MFFADSQLSMGVLLKIANASSQTNPLTANVDGSVYTLPQLLKARRWFDLDRGRWLEYEIQKRCARFQEPAKRKRSGSAATRSARRYRPYSLMVGVFFLMVSS